MKNQASLRTPAAGGHGELLILPDGKILAHNITPPLARVLAGLNLADAAMNCRANWKKISNHELPE